MKTCANATRWFASAVVAAFAACAVHPAAQEPTFRASTDAVYVVATVVGDDGALVTDLTKDDFDIREDGAARPITVFRNDPVPFAVSIMIDASASVSERLDAARDAVVEFARQFRPGDRANVGTFGNGVFIGPRFASNPDAIRDFVATARGVGIPCAHGMGEDRGQEDPDAASAMSRAMRTPFEWRSQIWDGIGCGIETVAADIETPRRVVLVFTDGWDDASSSTADQVAQLADRTAVIVYAVAMNGVVGANTAGLKDLAERTGGGFFLLHDNVDLSSVMARISDELRHQYVFGFAPASGRESRHSIKVLTGRPHAVVHARQVYVEPVAANVSVGGGAFPAIAAPAPAASTPSTPAVPDGAVAGSTALSNILDRFERGDWDKGLPRDIETDVPSMAQRLRRDATAWIGARGPEGMSRRRLVVATYVVDVLQYAENHAVWAPGQPASALIEWACTLVRQGPPLDAERQWHLAAMALLEHFAPSSLLQAHLVHAEARFPRDARWSLLRGVAQELDLPTDARGANAPLGAAQIARARQRYQEAMAMPGARDEALLRLAQVELSQNLQKEAVAHLDQMNTSALDPVVRYWWLLVRGRALEGIGRVDEAVECYRGALGEVPTSQSAALALGAALVAAHHADEAARIVSRAVAVDSAIIDPWLFYQTPDAAFFRAHMDSLFEAIRP